VSIQTSKTLRRQERDRALQRYENDRIRNQASASPGRHEFAIVLNRLKAGFNVPKIFRSAEVFGAREIHLIEIGPFDPAPAVGAFRRVPARFFQDFQQSYDDLSARGYTFFILEPGCKRCLSRHSLPPKSAFVFGHEEFGVNIDRSRYPDLLCLGIPQFGSTDSLNVSVAASIVMYEYVRQLETS
jgi:tRNA G18 (ribose-2'-O)-methylase SpoU